MKRVDEKLIVTAKLINVSYSIVKLKKKKNKKAHQNKIRTKVIFLVVFLTKSLGIPVIIKIAVLLIVL